MRCHPSPPLASTPASQGVGHGHRTGIRSPKPPPATHTQPGRHQGGAPSLGYVGQGHKASAGTSKSCRQAAAAAADPISAPSMTPAGPLGSSSRHVGGPSVAGAPLGAAATVSRPPPDAHRGGPRAGSPGLLLVLSTLTTSVLDGSRLLCTTLALHLRGSSPASLDGALRGCRAGDRPRQAPPPGAA